MVVSERHDEFLPGSSRVVFRQHKKVNAVGCTHGTIPNSPCGSGSASVTTCRCEPAGASEPARWCTRRTRDDAPLPFRSTLKVVRSAGSNTQHSVMVPYLCSGRGGLHTDDTWAHVGPRMAIEPIPHGQILLNRCGGGRWQRGVRISMAGAAGDALKTYSVGDQC